MYDLIIIGAGPAGTAAGVYAARKKLKTLLITEEFGGQSVVSETIYNWIGTPEIAGSKLASDFKDHLEYYNDGESLTLQSGYRVTSVEKNDNGVFIVTDSKDQKHKAKTVLVVSGSARRKLPAKGADRLEHKGLTYCATCDGPLFSGMDVVVVGGGNAGFESAAQLSAYCKTVTILQRGSEYRADEITVEKVLARENVTGILNAQTVEVTGENFVDGLVYKDLKTDAEHTLNIKGVFVEIGQIPNSGIVKDIVKLTDYNQIEIDPWTQKTSVNGLWAAGDVTNVRYHQNNISAGDAVKALEDIYNYLHA
ncbi:MAG: FAD-dependent oxidoreductase [Candidatus Pacebacteria bacterium]|nr:FAD-dependent oxidoreductase [Candidatus Paceibacterota bacterium]